MLRQDVIVLMLRRIRTFRQCDFCDVGCRVTATNGVRSQFGTTNKIPNLIDRNRTQPRAKLRAVIVVSESLEDRSEYLLSKVLGIMNGQT